MDAYSEDLRRKIVQALQQRGMNKSEAARAFGVSLSSVKRYAKAVREGRSLSPGKAPGKRPKLDEKARRLLEADVEERPFAKLSDRQEYLQKVAGVSVSESTLSRALRKMGFGRKKGRWVRARRIPKSCFSGDGDLLHRAGSLRILG
jgi:transposase